MSFEHIVMTVIALSLASIYGMTIWMERDCKRMEKDNKQIKKN